jgi:hypothetical protein
VQIEGDEFSGQREGHVEKYERGIERRFKLTNSKKMMGARLGPNRRRGMSPATDFLMARYAL